MQVLGIIKIFIFTILFLGTHPVKAQYNTGSDDLNKSLISIDANARLDFGVFKADISGSYDVSENKIDYLSVEIGMKAGDIYMTVELARITHRSIDQVVKVYQVHKGKGWGVIAKELGIKPGSAEFHALKGNAKVAKSNKAHKSHGPKNKGKKKS